MQEYFSIISHGHRKKLVSLAQKKGMNPDQAMGKIIQYLRSGSLNSNGPDYLKVFITPSHIERMIDTIML